MQIAMQDTAFSRIQSSLNHIHDHLDETLTVESLAEKSCWSRWQFQRVFNHYTGLSVAQYVRELRLSRAAELLLISKRKQLDIALECGFESEISFSRSFRQMFACTPGQYRKRGKRTGLKTPLVSLQWPAREISLPQELANKLLQIRVESQAEFQVQGVTGRIQGIFSEQPDFAARVPEIWRTLSSRLLNQCTLSDVIFDEHSVQGIGVLDTSGLDDGDTGINYWACVRSAETSVPSLEQLTIPAQEYAVIPFSGPAHLLDDTLEWFICHWLPGSGYSGLNRFDLEMYPTDFVANGEHLEMEYWIPVVSQ